MDVSMQIKKQLCAQRWDILKKIPRKMCLN